MELGLAGRTVALWAPPGPFADACRAVLEAEGSTVVDASTGAAGADAVVVAPARAGTLDLDGALDGASSTGADVLDGPFEPLVTAVTLYHETLSGMAEREWGRVVYVAWDDELDLVTAMGVLGVHKCVAWEWGPRAVTANAVVRNDAVTDHEVAAAVAFLVSKRAGYLSGITLAVDAGRRPDLP